MNKLYLTGAVLFVVSIVMVRNEETPSKQCPDQNFENLHERVQVKPCGKSRCKLQKGTNTTVIFKFKPDHEIKKLTNDVYGLIGGLPLPFLGVSGTSACANVKRADNGEPAPCPLEANQEYAYTNVFPIETFYPQVNVRVHWALNDGTRDILCFEVPAVITAAKTH